MTYRYDYYRRMAPPATQPTKRKPFTRPQRRNRKMPWQPAPAA